MIKTKLKITILMGVIACFLAVFCCMQVAFADNACSNIVENKSESHISAVVKNNATGIVTDKNKNTREFSTIDDLINICDNVFADSPEYIIDLNKDLDFVDKTLLVKEDKYMCINLNTFKIHSSCSNDMIKVKGDLQIQGYDSDKHGFVEQPYLGSQESSIVIDGGTISAYSITFISNATQQATEGGHIRFKSAGFCSTFEDCVFTGWGRGCAIDIEDTARDEKCHFRFLDCHFTNCIDTPIYVQCDNVNLDFLCCDFINTKRQVNYYGGAIDCEGDNITCTFDDTTFDNLTSWKGGAIYTDGDNCIFNLKNCNIKNCSTCLERYGDGGAIYSDGENVKFNFEKSSIESCVAQVDGGAIAIHGDSENFNFTNTTINNCSGDDGGAIYVRGSHVNLIGANTNGEFDNTISNCKASKNGGAIYTSAALNCGNNVLIQGLQFLSNSANDDGGAIKTKGSFNIIKKCFFKNNSAKGDGGAVYGYSGALWKKSLEPKLNDCEFTGNTCKGAGDQVNLSYIRTENISGNRIYYQGDKFDSVKNIYTDHYRDCTWSDCFKAIKIA